MADEIKDQRIITLMTPSELKAIDDWSFANRIRSRGDAIRRLTQIGLLTADNLNALTEKAVEFETRHNAYFERLSAYPESERGKHFMEVLANLHQDVYLDMLGWLVEVASFGFSATAIANGETVEDGMAAAEVITKGNKEIAAFLTSDRVDKDGDPVLRVEKTERRSQKRKRSTSVQVPD